jgi:metal-responsive CopG/Arc/MetJ family transcriptional regulator
MLTRMDDSSPRRLKKIDFRATEDLLKTLERLVRETGLSRSGVIKLAISEMAERRLATRQHRP